MTTRHLDPYNPAAVGYDIDAEDFIAARTEAQKDSALSARFDDELRAEAARFRHWANDVIRPHLSAMGPGPYDPTSPARMLARAKQKLADYKAWQETDDGKLYASLMRIRKSAEAMVSETFRLEACRDRRDGSILMEGGKLRLMNGGLRGEIDEFDSYALKVGQAELDARGER